MELKITGKIKNIDTPLIVDLSPIQIEVLYEFTLSQQAINSMKELSKNPVIGDIVQIQCSDLKIGGYGINYGLITEHDALIPIINKRLVI